MFLDGHRHPAGHRPRRHPDRVQAVGFELLDPGITFTARVAVLFGIDANTTATPWSTSSSRMTEII
ncbi:MAG: hypothetical protein R2716_05975 [Microthrixaceae bacterium]